MATDVSTHPVIVKLLKELKTVVSQDLVSVVLYGSAARGEYEKASSDLNVLIVVEDLNPTTLKALSGPIAKWVRSGQPSPRLLAPSIIRDSADVFPIEFLDLRAAHQVLCGADPFEDLEIHVQHLRIQCERELREKMMRLREAYLEVHNSERKLKRLLTDSYSTFVALFRGCLHLHGDEVPAHHDEVVDIFAALAELDRVPFEEVARLKHGQSVSQNPNELFVRYYEELTKAVSRVDRFEPSSGGLHE
jgi:predicted nucleotidyltransferase|tara:strand:- start:1002 stop:1745 length:744 start_codon:yes stop_codon:yes gene_type:complete